MKRSHKLISLACGLMLIVVVAADAGQDNQVFGFEEWQQAVSRLDVDPNEVVYPFHVTDEMRLWAEEKLRPFASASPEIKLGELQQAFFDRGEFAFEYEEIRTLTAEEAFAARHGNRSDAPSIARLQTWWLSVFSQHIRRQ